MNSLTLNLTNTKKYLVALYIVISSVTTSVLLNRIAFVVTMGIGFIIYLMTYDYKYRKNSFINCIVLYGLLLTISAYYTSAPAEKYNSVLSSYTTMVILVFLTISCIKSEEDIKFFMKVFIVTAVINCVYTYLTIGAETFNLLKNSETAFRLATEEQNANSVGMLAAYGAIFGIYFFMYEESEKRNILFYVLAIVLTSVFSLLSGSRKALLMLFSGMIMLVFHRNIQGDNAIRIFFKLTVAFVVVCVLFYWFMVSEFFSVVRERTDMLISGLSGNENFDHSARARMQMIETGWKVFWNAPLFGNGISSSYTYFLTYSHNNYVEILMNTGMVGLLIFYKPIVMGFFSLLRLKKEIREPIYIVALFVFVWLIVGGFGMVFYGNKVEMTVLAIFVRWLQIKVDKTKNLQKNNISKFGDEYGS